MSLVRNAFITAMALITICPMAQATVINAAQAKTAAVNFIGRQKASKVKLAASGLKHANWTTGKCYRFEVPLGVKDTSSNTEYKGNIWVEAETGRVVSYNITSYGYDTDTAYSKPLDKNKLISRSKALSLAAGIMKRAKVSSDAKRVNQAELKEYHHAPNSYNYTYVIRLAKYANLKGIGEVELPVNTQFEINAVTGELLRYDLYERPLRGKLVPPVITKAHAIKIVRDAIPKEQVNLHGQFGDADARLKALGQPLKNCLQLYWKVTVHRKNSRRDSDVTGMVDTTTGILLGITLPCSL